MTKRPVGTISFQSRFDQQPIAFSMKRYEHREGDAIWFFSVREHCSGDDLIRIEATERALHEMRDYIDEALKHIATPADTEQDTGGERG